MSESDEKYRQYLETLGEDAVRHQLANQMLMTARGELARAWLAEKPWRGRMFGIAIA